MTSGTIANQDATRPVGYLAVALGGWAKHTSAMEAVTQAKRQAGIKGKATVILYAINDQETYIKVGVMGDGSAFFPTMTLADAAIRYMRIELHDV